MTDAITATPDLTEHDCTCEWCVSCCMKMPCWGTPDEIRNIINAGLGAALMVVETHHDGDIQVLCPSSSGRNDYYNYWPVRGKCVFVDDDNRCELHDRGLKPLEGRVTLHGKDHVGLHEYVRATWQTYEGYAVIAQWKAGQND